MILGVDEAGRGSWAGPLVAGAVILEESIAGLADSKVLTKKKRADLSRQIWEKARAVSLGWVTNKEIDTLGLTEAVRLAMYRAVEGIQQYEDLIVDGSYNFLSGLRNSRAVVRADQSVPAVSAASIVAKVARDHYMAQKDLQFPGYGFFKHVGYGTAAHREALRALGPCEIHRKSYKPVKALVR